MQVFKVFFKIAWKNKVAMLIYTGIFMVIMSLYASNGASSNQNFENRKVNIAIFDYDNTEESKLLCKYMSSKHELIDVVDDERELKDYILFHKLDYVLYINQGYSKTGKISNIQRLGTFIGIYVEKDIERYESAMKDFVEMGYDLSTAYDKALEALDNEGLVTMSESSSDKNIVYYYYVNLPYIFIMIIIVGITPVIITFNKKEIRNRNEISCFRLRKRNMQMIAATTVITVILLVLFVVVSMISYNDEIFETGFFNIVVNSICFSLVGIGIISILSNFNFNLQSINGVANVIALSMAFLGGVFVPVELFTGALVVISKFVPTYWYVTALNQIFENGSTSDLLTCYGMQILFAMVFLCVGLVLSKKNRIVE